MTRLRSIEEQRELVESFTRPVENLLPLARLRERDWSDSDKWAELAELGWLGISLPEASGGIGLGPLEEALAAQKVGSQLVTPCYLATVIAAHVAADAGETALAADLACGAKRAALALTQAQDGTTATDAHGCDLLLSMELGRITLRAIEAVAAHDEVHWSLPVQQVSHGSQVASTEAPNLFAFARLLAAATLAGIATHSADLGLDYAKVREQFGQPIGAFQAVKHHCANMAITAYGARELVTFAAMALEDGDGEADFLAQAALNFALRAARDNAGTCIQVHGGIGFSAECDAHHFLKRAHLIGAGFGGIGAIRQNLIRTP